MTSKKDSPKEEAQTKSYVKPKKDRPKIARVVNPRLKARNDEMFKALVDNLNRNASKQDEEPDQE